MSMTIETTTTGNLLAVYNVSYAVRFTLSGQLEEAARLLLATFRFHYLLIREHFEASSGDGTCAELQAAMHGKGAPDGESDAYERLEAALRHELRCTSEDWGLFEPSLTIER